MDSIHSIHIIYIYMFNVYIYLFIYLSWIGHPFEIIFASLSWQFNTHFWVCLKMGIRPKWQSSLETWWWTRGSRTIKHNLIKLKKCSMLLPAVMVLNSYKWDNPNLECFPIIFLSLCLFVKGYNCSWLLQKKMVLGENAPRRRVAWGSTGRRHRSGELEMSNKDVPFFMGKITGFQDLCEFFFSVGYLGIRFW